MVILRQEQLTSFLDNIKSDFFIIPILVDANRHSLNNELCGLYLQTSAAYGLILFNHIKY